MWRLRTTQGEAEGCSPPWNCHIHKFVLLIGCSSGRILPKRGQMPKEDWEKEEREEEKGEMNAGFDVFSSSLEVPSCTSSIIHYVCFICFLSTHQHLHLTQQETFLHFKCSAFPLTFFHTQIENGHRSKWMEMHLFWQMFSVYSLCMYV